MTRRSIALSALLPLAITATAQWTQLGTTANNIIYTMEEFETKLYFGGNFTQFNGSTTYFSMSYNGSAWGFHTALLGGNGFTCMAVHDATLFGGGGLTGGLGGPNGVGVWSGSSWGGGYDTNNPVNVNALLSYNGDLIVGGSFTVPLPRIGRHNGTAYQAMGAGFDAGVSDLCVYNGELYAGGSMTLSGTTPLGYIAKWNGTGWENVGSGMNAFVSDLEVFDGQLYAAGAFTSAGGTSASHIARWNGTAWSAVGSGITYSTGGGITSLFAAPGGLLVGGKFTDAGGVTVANVAYYNGSSWSDPGGVPLDENVTDIETYQGQTYLVTYKGGIGAFAKVYRSSSVGFDEVAVLGDGLLLAPNPARDRLTVSGLPTGSSARYVIYDAAGRTQALGLLNADGIDIAALAPGHYRLEVVVNDGRRSLPFIKE